MASRRYIRLEKGIEVAGTRAEAYLLYEVPDGPKAYLLDAADTKQNGYALLIPPNPKTANAPASNEERLQKVEQLRKGGVISETESRKKRDEILNTL